MNSCYISNTEEVYELVVLILNEQFSKEISDLGRDLCYNGISTIPEIMQRMRLSFESVRNLLIILLQNKLVTTKEINKKENNVIAYEIVIDNVLNILLFPKILSYINKKFGEYSELIFEQFMQFGILSSFQIREQVKLLLSKIKPVNKIILDKITNSLINLIENNYIIQAKKLSFDNKANRINFENKIKKGKKAKNDKEKEKFSKEKESKSNKKERKKKELKLEQEKEKKINIIIDDENEKIDTTKNKTNNKNEDNEINNPLLIDKETNQFFYFFINYEQILSEFKSEIIIDFINQKLSTQAGLIANILLEKNQIASFKEGKTFSCNYETITQKFRSINISQIDDIIKEQNEFFSKVSSDSLILNLDIVSQFIKESTIEKVILQQFSESHLRIYRLLNLCGALDSKNIMEICLIPPKQINMILNQLFSFGYIQNEIVNVKGSNIMFYSVNINQNIEKIINMTYKMIKNLKVSLNEELENYKGRVSNDKKEQYITKIYSAINQLYDAIIVLKYL